MSLALVAPAILPVQAANAQEARMVVAQEARIVVAQEARMVLAQYARTGIERLREESRPAPAVSFTDVEGKPHSFTDFAGQGLVVNFWATWCPPCVAEMPALDRLHAMVARDGIEVLALSNDRGGRAQVEPFYQRTNLRHMAIWLDPRGATGRALAVRVLPTTILIDRRGLEVARLMGEAEWDQPEVVAAIRRLTRTPASAETSTRT